MTFQVLDRVRSKGYSVYGRTRVAVKRTMPFMIVLAMLISFLVPMNVSAADTKVEAYEAYYDLLQQKMDKIGYYPPSTIESTSYVDLTRDGLLYARLVDFDNSGIPELFYIEVIDESVFWYVYTYWNNTLIQTASDEISLLLGVEFGFSVDANNKPYFVYITDVAQSDENWYFSSLTDGEWKTKRFRVNMAYDWSEGGYVNGEHWWVHSDGMHVIGYTIDGVSVDYSEYTRQKDFMMANSSEIYNLQRYTYLGKLPLPDWAPHKVIEELEAVIPADYISHYRTPSSWAAEQVNAAIEAGIVPVSLQNKYSTPITRAEFCALATAFYEKTTGSVIAERSQFHDTSDINVEKMAGLGVVSGVGGGNFAPNDSLTREMAAVILANLSEALNVSLPESAPAYADNSSISSWAGSQVGKMQQSKIMSGVSNNCFAPQDLYTREQSIATIMRMENVFIPAEEIEIPKTLEIVVNGTAPIPEAVILPANTTDKNLTWESSDRSIFTVDSKAGELKGVKVGEAVLTAKTQNGVTATCNITVRPAFRIQLPVTVNFLANYGISIYGGSDISSIEDVPDNPVVAGKITVTDICEVSTEKLEVTAKTTEITDGYEDEYDSLLNPYLKWVVKDQDGNIVDSGVRYVNSDLNEEVTFNIIINDAKVGEPYTLEFINDEGKTQTSIQENTPEIEMPDLPFRVSYKENTLTVDDIVVDYEYDPNDDVYLTNLRFCGNTDMEKAFILVHFGFELKDASGEVIEDDSYLYPDSVSSDGDFEVEPDFYSRDIELKGGETYYLTLTGNE